MAHVRSRLCGGLCILFILGALSGLALNAQPVRGGRLIYLQRGEPRTLNPVFAVDAPSHEVVWRMHADLVHINRETQRTEPALAESWSALKNGRGFRVKLRRGVRFSDGHELDADDVVFTFQAHLDPAVASPQRELLVVNGKPIGVKKLDAYTLEFDLGGPYGPAERIFDSIAILPRHLLEPVYKSGRLAQAWSLADKASAMAGLGPFRLKSYSAGQGLVLERNPYYWRHDARGQQLPYLDEIVFRTAANEEGQVLRFAGGDGDVLNRISAKSLSLLERDAAQRGIVVRDLGASLEYSFLFFNLNPTKNVPQAVAAKQAWFRDARFRRAIAMSVDRDAMVKLVYGGRATPLSTHVTPANRLWRDATLPPVKRNVGEALKLLASAGYRKGTDGVLRDSAKRAVEFTIIVSASNQERAQMAAMIQQDLRALGIAVQVATLEFRTLLERVLRSKNYEACLFGLGSGDVDPGSEMNVWPSGGATHVWSPAQEQPSSEWESEIDRLMRQQMATQAYAARKRLYDRVQQIEVREAPVVVLVSPNVLVAAKSRVGNFRPVVLDHYTLWNADEIYLRSAPVARKK